MNLSITCVRTVFAFLAITMLSAFSIAQAPTDNIWTYLLFGISGGALLTAVLFGIERWLRGRATLYTLNLLILGLFIGAVTAMVVQILLSGLFSVIALALGPLTATIVQATIYLSVTFFALILTMQASEELHLTIPFVRFKPTAPKKRDLLLDGSVLQDPRLIDLAASGLIDDQSILPRFIVHELQEQSNHDDETIRSKARFSLEVIAKLETLPYLQLHYTDVDFPDLKDPIMRLTRLARHLDANILTADINRVQQSAIEGVRIINIHNLSNALKPLMQKGEILSIKIQRPGKDPQQGVGYLEDGTMVVVNGGANYMQKTIQAQVLGVKHTSSGRMIFCNAIEEENFSPKREMPTMILSNGEREMAPSKLYFGS